MAVIEFHPDLEQQKNQAELAKQLHGGLRAFGENDRRNTVDVGRVELMRQHECPVVAEDN